MCQLRSWLLVACFISTVLAYVEFGTITHPSVLEPTFTIPRPHQLPDDVWMRYGPYHSQLTAIAPSITFLKNGSQVTSWSLHSHLQPSRTIEHQGLRKRGVFAGDPPIPTCRQCNNSSNPINDSNSTDSGSPTCSVTDYDGVFRDGAFPTSALPDYCFNAGYTGPLLPGAQPTDAGLPCCPICYPPGLNNTGIITTGVLSTSTPVISSPNGGGPTIGRPTVTITATEIGTSTQSTLSIETIIPTITASPTTSTGFATIIGCGTASGCGTVIGSGTVYLAPFGFPAVTSSGTISGCAPTVIGCGTMIATTGVFTGTASITGCGEGTGSATMVGSGTVWPAGFMDMISFVSSGTLTGSGRVKGCGSLVGTGTFSITAPYTTTVTPGATPTVNVYVSYCPPDPFQPNPLAAMRLAGNFSGQDDYYKYALSPTLAGGRGLNYTQLNVTGNSTLGNPLCHVCPEDSGICCPPYSDCGSDGHCPWTALEGSGYARFGVNLVDVRNSSSSLGMSSLPAGAGYARLRAPGLPGSSNAVGSIGASTGEDAGLANARRLRKRLGGSRGSILHGRLHNHIPAHAGRIGIAHGHGN